MALDRPESHLGRGHRYQGMPIPMVPEHCVAVDAGPLRFVVESRVLTNDIIRDAVADLPPDMLTMDDGGPTLHVCGRDDEREYLRFDCFEQEPHYHYIDHTVGSNVVVRIDEIALGDTVDFALRCVEQRLPAMLRNCGADALASVVEAEWDDVVRGIEALDDLMERARLATA